MEEAEKEKVKSKRETYLESLKSRKPDLDIEDDEALFGAISDENDDMSGRLSKQEEIDRAMSERFEKDPAFGGFFLDAIGGKSPVVALIERYGEDIRAYLDDPEKVEELAEANQKYLDRLSEESKLEEQYNSNIEASFVVADELQSEGGYTDEQINEAFSAILMDAQKAILGEISKEMLETKLKGLNYDADIAEAEQVAEVRGKNTKIEEKIKKFDDNLPPMIDGKASGHAEKKKTSKEVDALDRLTKKPDIWDGMKRSRT